MAFSLFGVDKVRYLYQILTHPKNPAMLTFCQHRTMIIKRLKIILIKVRDACHIKKSIC